MLSERIQFGESIRIDANVKDTSELSGDYGGKYAFKSLNVSPALRVC